MNIGARLHMTQFGSTSAVCLCERAGHLLTVYTATAATMADSNMCRKECPSCRLQKDNVKDIASKSVGRPQWRCDDCSRLLNRISRLQSRGLLASERYQALTTLQKINFMRAAKDMFGDDINQTICDTIDSFDQLGSFDQPDHDLADADQSCDVTPPRRKRKRSSENQIATVFKKKESDAKMITLSERQTRIRDTAEQQLTEACVELDAAIMAANAAEIKPGLQEALRHMVSMQKSLRPGLQKVIEAVCAFKEERVGKKQFLAWLQEAKLCVKTCTSIKDELHSYVEDAQNEQHDEHE